MKLETKKIFAKEFLMLMIVLLIGLVCFFGTYAYNAFRSKQIDSVNTELKKVIDLASNISSSYDIKSANQNRYFEQISKHYDITKGHLSTRTKLWNRLTFLVQSDSLKFKWKLQNDNFVIFHERLGFDNLASFNKFIIANIINSKDRENYRDSNVLRLRIKNFIIQRNDLQSKLLSFNDQVNFVVNACTILFVVSFGLRYLFYALRWSVRTLKQ